MLTQEKIFQLFGYISVFYSTLDFMVTNFIAEIVNEEYKPSKNKMDNLTLGQKLEIVKKLNTTNVKSVEALEIINKVIDEAIKVSKERNRFIHDQWVFNPNDMEKGRIHRVSIKLSEKWKMTVETSHFYTEKDLTELLTKIGKLQVDFSDATKIIPGSIVINNNKI